MEEYTWDLHLAIFYIFCCLLIIILVLCLYIQSIRSNSFSILSKIVYTCLHLLITVLYFPVLGTMTSILKCKRHSHALTNIFHPELVCFKDTHLIHSIFSICFASLTVAVSLAFTYLLHDMRLQTGRGTAKVSVRFEICLVVHKTAMALLNNLVYNWIVYVYACAANLYFLVYCRQRKFFNRAAQRIFNGFIVLNLFAAICFSSNIAGYMTTLSLFIIYISGSTLLLLTICVYPENPPRLFRNQPLTSEELTTAVLTYLDLAAANTRNDLALIRGYSLLHGKSCTIESCVLKKCFDLGLSVEEKGVGKELLWHASEMLQKNVLYKMSNELRLLRALILIDLLNDNGGALEELTIVEQSKPTFKEQCLIYQYRQAIKDKFILLENDSKEKQNIALAISYKSNSCSLVQKIQQATFLHAKFWDTLLSSIPDIAKLRDFAFQIQETVSEIEFHWEQMQEICPDDPTFTRLYASFANKVLNDKDLSGKLREGYSQSVKDKFNFHEQRLSALNNESLEFINPKGEPFISVSGLQSSLGAITSCNSALCSLFGYSKKELIGQSVSMLLPQFLANRYKQIVSGNVEKLVDELVAKEKHAIGKAKNGYIISLYVELLSKPSLLNDMNYMALLHIDKSTTKSYTTNLLVDTALTVRNMSASGILALGLKSHMLESSLLQTKTLFPEITLDHQVQRDVEVRTRLYIPELKELEDSEGSDSAMCGSEGAVVKQGKMWKEVRLYIEPLRVGESEVAGYFLRVGVSEKTGKKVKRAASFPKVKFCYDPRYSVYYMSSSKREVRVYGESREITTSKRLALEQLEVADESNFTESVKKLNNAVSSHRSLFFYTVLQKLKVVSQYLDSGGRSYDTAALNKLANDIIEKNCFRYADGIATYCIVDGSIENTEKQEPQTISIEEGQETLGGGNKLKRALSRKKSTFLISNNIKGRKSLETTLGKEKNAVLKWIAAVSYTSLLALSLLAVFNYAYLRSFFKSINKRLDLVNLSYHRLVVEQMLMYDAKEAYFVKEYIHSQP